jgi:glycosyltransferase involved in cell wall biosynthesis
MKLAFVIKTLGIAGGGAERVLGQVTAGLAARGHEVTIVSFGSRGEPDFYEVDDRVDRLWLGSGDVAARSTAVDLLRRAIALRRAIKGLAPDVAVGFMHSAYIPLAVALSNSRVPVIASEHIVYDHYRHLPAEALALRLTAPLYARITVISEAIRRSYPKGLADRMEVISNPVTRAARVADPVGGSSKILLNVGRLFEQKDQRTLIGAFALVAGAYPDWTLRILGEGPLRSMLETLVREKGLESRVQLPGAVSDIAREYESAQVFAMPSLYESFGLATAEALAHGLPAIGFADCPGTNELIRDTENGLLVPPVDRVTDLAARLAQLMEDAELRRRLGRAGPASVERFSLESIVSQWEKLLRRCVDGRRGRKSNV